MTVAFVEYRAKRIVNVHRHVDGPWFWDKYSAHPYIGCRSGCSFCYQRGRRYPGSRRPNDFDQLIRVKTNAAEALRRELGRLEPELIVCGDWQKPAEDRYRLSRAMLEVICELRFPLLVIERSPLVVRDLDLLGEIGRRSWVGVIFSVSNVDPALKHAFEPRSPGVARRFRAMQQLAAAGIRVGTALMPIIPIVGDDENQLERVVRATKDHGGEFVIAGGLTLDGAQRRMTIDAASTIDPGLAARFEQTLGATASSGDQRARIGLTVRALCERHGLRDRMPRPIVPGETAINKRIAERLFLRAYELELEQAAPHRVWAYRKAAWAVDECRDALVEGDRLRDLPAIGSRIRARIAHWLAHDRERSVA